MLTNLLRNPLDAVSGLVTNVLGKEPVVLTGGAEAVLAALLAFGLPGLTADRVGLIMAATTAALAFVTAAYTRHATLALLVGAVKAAAALAIAYGLHLTDQQVAALIGVVMGMAAFWQRGQTGPAAAPGLRDEQPVQVAVSVSGKHQGVA